MNAKAGMIALAVGVAVAAEAGSAAAQSPTVIPVADREPLIISPGEQDTGARPNTSNQSHETPPVEHGPAFVGPLSGETPTGRAGMAGWISPNNDVGSRGSNQPQRPGWAGFGFSIEWGRRGKSIEAGQ